MVTVVLVGAIGVFFYLYPNFWITLFSNNEKVILITKQYLTTVGICYPFFALGLGLYFVCQAFNTLLWPVFRNIFKTNHNHNSMFIIRI